MTDRTLDVLRGRASAAAPVPQPAKVNRVAAGKLYVTFDAAPRVEVGPVLWSRPALPVTECADAAHSHPQLDPPRGTACLVLTVGGATWLLAFSAWPP